MLCGLSGALDPCRDHGEPLETAADMRRLLVEPAKEEVGAFGVVLAELLQPLQLRAVPVGDEADLLGPLGGRQEVEEAQLDREEEPVELAERGAEPGAQQLGEGAAAGGGDLQEGV